jgi:hypothetical protein
MNAPENIETGERKKPLPESMLDQIAIQLADRRQFQLAAKIRLEDVQVDAASQASPTCLFTWCNMNAGALRKRRKQPRLTKTSKETGLNTTALSDEDWQLRVLGLQLLVPMCNKVPAKPEQHNCQQHIAGTLECVGARSKQLSSYEGLRAPEILRFMLRGLAGLRGRIDGWDWRSLGMRAEGDLDSFPGGPGDPGAWDINACLRQLAEANLETLGLQCTGGIEVLGANGWLPRRELTTSFLQAF